MKWKHLFTLTVVATGMGGCVEQSVASGQRIEVGKPFAVTGNTKRINTVSCHDHDDWYLDGYRVGKSFREHHKKMLSQRTTYCQEQSGKTISPHLLASWQNGYQQGVKR
ncbi:hypothetical protein [Pasteurella sp. PK-2025]|uniref:hypothetical protein n=1 Tax=unclassified Pasteurella TaxID=2621516 RepID=UPI003C726F29